MDHDDLIDRDWSLIFSEHKWLAPIQSLSIHLTHRIGSLNMESVNKSWFINRDCRQFTCSTTMMTMMTTSNSHHSQKRRWKCKVDLCPDQAEWETTSRKWGWIWLEKVGNTLAEMGHHIELQCFSDVNHTTRNNVSFHWIHLNVCHIQRVISSPNLKRSSPIAHAMFLPAWWMGRNLCLICRVYTCNVTSPYRYTSILYISVLCVCWEFLNIHTMHMICHVCLFPLLVTSITSVILRPSVSHFAPACS